jgi:hypothetical protein
VHHKAFKEMMATKEEMKDLIGKLQKSHNEIASKLLEIEERVGSHDFQLNSKMNINPKMRTKP